MARSNGERQGLALLQADSGPVQEPSQERTLSGRGRLYGGSAKQGRDRKFQAILPLRGKVINTAKAKMADILKNEEINTMICTIERVLAQTLLLEDANNYDRLISS